MKIEHTDINFRHETINGVLYLPDTDNPSPLVIHLNGMPGLEPEKEGERSITNLCWGKQISRMITCWGC